MIVSRLFRCFAGDSIILAYTYKNTQDQLHQGFLTAVFPTAGEQEITKRTRIFGGNKNGVYISLYFDEKKKKSCKNVNRRLNRGTQ
jgi:hypothetical protein